MSNVTVLQTAANRFSRVAGFAPIVVDGVVGSQTLGAVQRALDYIAVIEDSDVTETLSDQASAWASAGRTISTLSTNAQPIGGFLTFVADLLKLGFVASPIVPVATNNGGVAPSAGLPIIMPSSGGASILDAWRALATWKKIALGAFAGFLVIFLHGKYKRSRGLSGLGSTLYLYTYRNNHGAYADVWAHDAEHARAQVRRKADRPRGPFSVSRVTNVPARRVA